MQKRASALLSRGPDAIRPPQANCDNLNRLPDVLVEWRLSRQRAGGREESGLGSKADVDRPPSHPAIRRRGPRHLRQPHKGALSWSSSRVRLLASDPHCIPRALVAKQERTIDLLDIDLAILVRFEGLSVLHASQPLPGRQTGDWLQISLARIENRPSAQQTGAPESRDRLASRCRF